MCFAKVSFPRPQRLEAPIRVRIDKCSHAQAWYTGRVGEIVNVEFEDGEGYWAREGGVYNAINVIRKGDATLLPLNN
jgi:hypothetical protein